MRGIDNFRIVKFRRNCLAPVGLRPLGPFLTGGGFFGAEGGFPGLGPDLGARSPSAARSHAKAPTGQREEGRA